MREEFIGLMQELEVSRLNGDLFEVRIAHSFDVALFKLEHPELATQFVKEVTITKVKDELVNKKLLAEKYPEVFGKYNVP